MIGLSLMKIIFTLIVVFLVWRVFSWIRQNRLNQSNRQSGLGGSDRAATLEPQDTAQCAVCKAYVPIGTGDCGRGDCPYPLS